MFVKRIFRPDKNLRVSGIKRRVRGQIIQESGSLGAITYGELPCYLKGTIIHTEEQVEA